MSDTWRAIWPYLRRQSRALTIAAGAAVVIAAAEILRPFPLKFVIDHLFQSGDVSGMEFDDVVLLAAVAALVIGIALVEAGAGYVMDLSLVRAGERVTHDLRVAVYAHLQRLSLGFHRRRHAGDLVTRVTGDVNAVGTLISSSAGSLVTAVLTLAGMAVVAFIIDPVLAIVAFATTPVVAIAAIRFRRRVAVIQRQQRATEGEMASLATETLGSIEQVRALGTEDFEHGRLEQKSEERRVAGAEGGLVEGRFTRFIDVVSAIGTAIVLVVGVVRVSDGMLSPGDLIVMVTYARRIQRPLRTMARDWVRSSRAMARAERVAELLDTDDHLVDGSGPAPDPGAATSVELEAVTFAYEPSRPIIRDVSLVIPAGSRLALIGRSGAGKSTLAALVARLHDPSDGRVLIGGRDTRELPLAWMRERIGFVLQDAALFSGSVAENIGWGIDVGRDAVIQAARSAGADEFIQDLPDGYDSQLDPGGAGLSGGQRQRIAIARTLLRDPSILILDEPTRGLDAASERAVLAGLDQLMRDRTTIIITHDRALARLADAVAIIDGGRLERTGPPNDLLGDDDVHTPPATEERAQFAMSPAAAPLMGPRS